MSRGLIILIVVLSLALGTLLILPKLKHSDATASASNSVAGTAVPSNQMAATTPVVRSTTPVGTAVRTNVGQVSPAVRSNIAHHVLTMITNESAVTNMLADPPTKTLPELERDYGATTNRDTRLDVMMDIAEANNADAVKALTRLFELEKDPDLKVDLLDSLLGIEGFKDEKLVMLTLGIRQGLSQDIRQSAIDGLIDLEDTRSIPLLNALLNDPDAEIRQSAQDAIEILQAPPPQIPKVKLQ